MMIDIFLKIKNLMYVIIPYIYLFVNVYYICITTHMQKLNFKFIINIIYIILILKKFISFIIIFLCLYTIVLQHIYGDVLIKI